MLHTKFYHWFRRRFFIIYAHGGHLGHVTRFFLTMVCNLFQVWHFICVRKIILIIKNLTIYRYMYIEKLYEEKSKIISYSDKIYTVNQYFEVEHIL